MQRYGNLPPYNLAKIASAQEIVTRITQLPISSSIVPLISIHRKFKMPGTNWRVAHGMGQIHGQAVGMEGGDWRTQLPPCSRHRVVYKIMETLRSLNSPAGQEYLQDPEVTAVEFEENIFTAATSQSDYLRKISLKLLALEKKPQYPMVNSLQSNAASNSRNSQDPVMAAGMEGSDWKIRLHPESRQRIVNKIVEMLRRYLPFSELEGEGLQVLIDMAARFEENVYTAARTQTEYLRKISLKMLTLAREGRNPSTNSFPSIVL